MYRARSAVLGVAVREGRAQTDDPALLIFVGEQLIAVAPDADDPQVNGLEQRNEVLFAGIIRQREQVLEPRNRDRECGTDPKVVVARDDVVDVRLVHPIHARQSAFDERGAADFDERDPILAGDRVGIVRNGDLPVGGAGRE
jgi:hypothetical protein